MALKICKLEQILSSRTWKSPNPVQYRVEFCYLLVFSYCVFSRSTLNSASSGTQNLGVRYDYLKSVLEDCLRCFSQHFFKTVFFGSTLWGRFWFFCEFHGFFVTPLSHFGGEVATWNRSNLTEPYLIKHLLPLTLYLFGQCWRLRAPLDHQPHSNVFGIKIVLLLGGVLATSMMCLWRTSFFGIIYAFDLVWTPPPHTPSCPPLPHPWWEGWIFSSFSTLILVSNYPDPFTHVFCLLGWNRMSPPGPVLHVFAASGQGVMSGPLYPQRSQWAEDLQVFLVRLVPKFPDLIASSRLSKSTKDEAKSTEGNLTNQRFIPQPGNACLNQVLNKVIPKVFW